MLSCTSCGQDNQAGARFCSRCGAVPEATVAREVVATVLDRAGRIDEVREALEQALVVWERKRCVLFVRRTREQIEPLERTSA